MNFCIVPCCVFPTVYKRTLNNHQEVLSREQLIQWIAEECERRGWGGQIKKFKLGFMGADEGICGII